MPDIEVTIVEATPINVEITKTGPPGGGEGGGAVDSVFGRTGVVVAQDNDYEDTQVYVDDTDIKVLTDNQVSGSNVHEIFTSLLTNFGNVIVTIFTALANAFDKTTDTLDDITAGATNKHFTSTEKTKLSGIESGAEVNNISDPNATDLTDGNDSTLHYHLSDRDVKPRLTGGVAYRQTQLDNWFAALLAATSAAPIDVVVVGDSLHALGSLTVPPVAGYFEQYLNQQLGVAETTSVPIGVYAQADYSPTATSTQGTLSATALGGFGSTLTDAQVLTHVATCTGFSVAYRTDPSFGTLTIRDGAGGTVLATINCAATAKSGNVWHSGALSAGSHTLHITSTGTTRVEIIHPNYGHKVRVWNCAHSGYKSADYTTNSYLANDLIDTLDAAGTLKLVIIATGANDNGGSGYATDIPALIASVQSHTSEDLVLWLPYISGAFPLAEYTPARVAAYATGLPVIDASTVAATSIGLDGTHPDTWQKRMLALQETAMLGGDPLGTMIRQIHDTNRGGISVPSPYGSLPEFANVSKLLSPFFGMPGAGLYLSDGISAVNLAQKALNQLSISNGAGTLEGNLSPAINAQTGTTYTLVLADAGKHITRSNASASTQTLPQNSDAAIPIGTIIEITNLGAGGVAFVAGTGATIAGAPVLRQHQSALMIKTATNTWQIVSPELGRTAAIPPTSGDYYSMGGQAGAGSPGLVAAGKIVFHPIWLDVGTLDRIAVSTSAAAVSTWRLGLYKADPITGLPDGMTPFLDAGTVDMNATPGVQAIVINQAITEPGLYWAAVLVDAYTAQPTTHNVVYSSNSGIGILGLPQDMSSLGRFRVGRSYGSTVPTGSLPTAPTSSMTWAGTIPRVAVRYA